MAEERDRRRGAPISTAARLANDASAKVLLEAFSTGAEVSRDDFERVAEFLRDLGRKAGFSDAYASDLAAQVISEVFARVRPRDAAEGQAPKAIRNPAAYLTKAHQHAAMRLGRTSAREVELVEERHDVASNAEEPDLDPPPDALQTLARALAAARAQSVPHRSGAPRADIAVLEALDQEVRAGRWANTRALADLTGFSHVTVQRVLDQLRAFAAGGQEGWPSQASVRRR